MNFGDLQESLLNSGKEKGRDLAENFLKEQQAQQGEGTLAGTGIGFGKQMLENFLGGGEAANQPVEGETPDGAEETYDGNEADSSAAISADAEGGGEESDADGSSGEESDVDNSVDSTDEENSNSEDAELNADATDSADAGDSDSNPHAASSDDDDNDGADNSDNDGADDVDSGEDKDR